ncbi:hypothetical protein [Acinetobacter schindleri]|uniref:hypothetical protein n=1 Tax=Acinetobacter schindleri TaxID=108981 RepID=UPI00161819B9|nr:hypothetical protein [Acinetobacter schindleri]MBB4836885.1 hypothetical protein [Acinetobacter schindleri]WBX36808.1 hypothetical protein MYA84_08685 [Acinetobacter schindleri]
MNLNKEQSAYLTSLVQHEAITQDEFNDITYKPEINAFHSEYLSSRFIDKINWGWSSWQAAKARAVPKGFVLVPKEPTQKLYRTFYDAFNSANAGNTAQCFKVAYKAMIEAQEQK